MQLRIEIPKPPRSISEHFSGSLAYQFEPDEGLERFLFDVILTEHSPFYNVDHVHLFSAKVGFLWTNCYNSRHGRRIVGQAEIPNFRGGKWQKARGEKQLVDWFGDIPDFVITLDAEYARECDDAAFLALFEHELYHCGQALDRFGFPKFSKETGQPIFAMRGHDVEEFIGVVRRYGHKAAGQNVTGLIDAALVSPEIAAAKVRELCGTCSRV